MMQLTPPRVDEPLQASQLAMAASSTGLVCLQEWRVRQAGRCGICLFRQRHRWAP